MLECAFFGYDGVGLSVYVFLFVLLCSAVTRPLARADKKVKAIEEYVKAKEKGSVELIPVEDVEKEK
jgi:hypothetical protein